MNCLALSASRQPGHRGATLSLCALPHLILSILSSFLKE